MPLHTNTPGQSTMVFVHPKEGKFVIDSTNEQYEAIEGTLDRVAIEQDPGNPKYKIQPYEAFIMHIRDEDSIYRIKINAERNFAFSVAKVLADLQKGDKIIAKVKAGDDPTVTFCNILKNVDGNWVRPVAEELPADKAKKVARLKEIVESHSAKALPKSE